MTQGIMELIVFAAEVGTRQLRDGEQHGCTWCDTATTGSGASRGPKGENSYGIVSGPPLTCMPPYHGAQLAK